MNPNYEQNLGHDSEVVLSTTVPLAERGSRKLFNMMATRLDKILFPRSTASIDPKNWGKITSLLLLGELLGMSVGAVSVSPLKEILPVPWISLVALTTIMIGAGVGASAGYRLGCRIS